MSTNDKRTNEYNRKHVLEEQIITGAYYRVVDTPKEGNVYDAKTDNIKKNNCNGYGCCCYCSNRDEEKNWKMNEQNRLCCAHRYKRKKLENKYIIENEKKENKKEKEKEKEIANENANEKEIANENEKKKENENENENEKNNYTIFTNSDIICNILPFFNFSERWKFKLLNKSFLQAFNTKYSWRNLDIRFFDIDLFHCDFLKKYNKLYFNTVFLSLSVDGNENLEITINSIMTHFKYLKDLRLYFRKKNTNFIYEGVHPIVSKFLKFDITKDNKREHKKYVNKRKRSNCHSSINTNTNVKTNFKDKIKKEESISVQNFSNSNNAYNINLNQEDVSEEEKKNNEDMLADRQNKYSLYFEKKEKVKQYERNSLQEKTSSLFFSRDKQLEQNERNEERNWTNNCCDGCEIEYNWNNRENIRNVNENNRHVNENNENVNEDSENEDGNIFSVDFINADCEYNNYFLEDALYKYIHNKKEPNNQIKVNALLRKYIDIIEAKRICRFKKIENHNNFTNLERLIIDVELKGEQLLCFVGKLNNLKDIIISKLLYSDKLNRSQNIIIFTCFIEKIKKNNIRLIQLGLYFRHEYKPVDYINNESFRKILRERKEYIYNINKEEGDELMYILQKNHLSSLYCLWSNDLFISFEMYEQIKNFRNLKIWILPGWRALSLAKQ